MDYNTILGYAASFMTTTAFVPQAYKTWKTKSAKDISLAMFLMFIIGVVLWIIYGFLRNDLPLIFGNIITFSLATVILYYKLRENSKKNN
jgi:MtN3 and saliva related transmembrane protein